MTDPTTTTAGSDKIVISHATKVIRRRTVLDDVSLELPRGGIYGFSGINGSGKTMLFRAIAGLIHLTSGTIDVFGQRIGRDASFPTGLGLILENVGFWEEYTGFDNLRLLASIRGAIGEREDPRRTRARGPKPGRRTRVRRLQPGHEAAARSGAGRDGGTRAPRA